MYRWLQEKSEEVRRTKPHKLSNILLLMMTNNFLPLHQHFDLKLFELKCMVIEAIMSKPDYLIWWIYLLLTLSGQQLTEIDYSLFFLGNGILVEHHGNHSAPWSMLWVPVSKSIRMTLCIMVSVGCLVLLTSSPQMSGSQLGGRHYCCIKIILINIIISRFVCSNNPFKKAIIPKIDLFPFQTELFVWSLKCWYILPSMGKGLYCYYYYFFYQTNVTNVM